MSAHKNNIYKLARQSAGYTQEAAAELLNISDTSIRCYERGERIPPNEVVEAMCVVYDAQFLAYQHIHNTNSYVGKMLPEIEQRSLTEAALRIYNSLAAFQKKNGVERLMEIAEDGVISNDERQDFDAVLEELRRIIQSALELKLYCDPGKEEHHDK